jgi:hypothetical protein
MTISSPPRTNFAQEKREYRAEMAREAKEVFPAFHTSQVMGTVHAIYKNVPVAAEQDVRQFIKEYLQRQPEEPISKRMTATHEAGHFVTFEALGMKATQAKIAGVPFGRGDWSGIAWSLERPALDTGLHEYRPYTPDDLIDEACAALAGPWAEVSLANGAIEGSVSEIIEVGFLAARAAEMLGKKRCQVLADIFERTAAIVDAYKGEIEGIAACLERRKRISRGDRPIKKILGCVRKKPVSSLPRASQASIDKLTRLMNDATSGIDALIARVTTRGPAR